MSVSVDIRGFCDNKNSEFIRHKKAVEFCAENKLSLPKETSEFFKGKIGEYEQDLEDFEYDAWTSLIKNGIEVELPIKNDPDNNYRWIINIKELPKTLNTIIIEVC